MKFFLVTSTSLIVLILIACSSFIKNKNEVFSSGPTEEEIEISKIEKSYYLNDRSAFSTAKEKFTKDFPNSNYKLFIELLTSRLLFQDNQFSQALEMNQSIQKSAYNVNNKIYYETLFYSSDIYESLGRLDNSLAVLVEAENYGLFLSDRVRLFELPLKLSIAYARLNQNEMSLNYINKTESGLKEYLSKENHSKKTLSEIYFEIGAGVPSPALADYYTDAKKFSLIYKYLIYCLHFNETPYSEKSKQQLILQINSLWNQTHDGVAIATGDKIADDRLRFKKLTDFSRILNSIKLFEPLEDRQVSTNQKEFFLFIDEIQNKTFNEIYAQYKLTPPTEESFGHGIFRGNLKTEKIEAPESIEHIENKKQ